MVVGMVLGAMIFDMLMKVTLGRRKALLWAGAFGVTAAGCMCILNKWVIMSMKFLYGAGAAYNLAGTVLYMNEMLPPGSMRYFGWVINLGIVLGMWLIQWMGTKYYNSIYFTFLYVSMWPPFMYGLTFLFWMYAYENEPLDYTVDNSHTDRFREQTGNNINTLYAIEKTDAGPDRKVVDAIRDERRIPIEIRGKNEKADMSIKKRWKKAKDEQLAMDDEPQEIVNYPTLIETFADERYRPASLISCLLAVCYALSGYCAA